MHGGLEVLRFRMIAVDLDDTLLDDGLDVSPRSLQALADAKALGVVVTIATGRMFRSALPFAGKLALTHPIITYQGALIKEPVPAGRVIWHKPVPLQLARQVISAGYQAGVHMNVYLDDNLYVDDITPEGTGYAKRAGVEMTAVGSLLDFLQHDPTKILYIAEPGLLDDLQKELKKRFGHQLYITKSKPNYLEFMNPEATKGHAVKALAESLGIAREEVIAFGDSDNDVDMIEYAGLGVAMGNGWPRLKDRAGYVTKTNNEDGVADAIERFILRQKK